MILYKEDATSGVNVSIHMIKENILPIKLYKYSVSCLKEKLY